LNGFRFGLDLGCITSRGGRRSWERIIFKKKANGDHSSRSWDWNLCVLLLPVSGVLHASIIEWKSREQHDDDMD